MLEKRIQFSSVSDTGEQFLEVLYSSRKGTALEKIATASHLMPEVSHFLRTLKSDPRFQYVLMTPMGAFEYWGDNSNGDAFPEDALRFKTGTDDPAPFISRLVAKYLDPLKVKLPPGDYTVFGHKTFENAQRYLHHVNKNPEISYGTIPLAVWNPLMHRVELIVKHDREKAKQVGASHVIEDIDNGKRRFISMGAKVPFDVCSVCGNLARTTAEYCTHLKFQMGKILDSGVVVCAYNLFPRFFDLSDVIVPAAKESGVLLKVASKRQEGSYVGELMSRRPPQEKQAEIKKQVLPNTPVSSKDANTLEELEADEPDLPFDFLKLPLDKILSTTAGLGIVLKPREFQTCALCHQGKEDLASRLLQSKTCFPLERGEEGIGNEGPELDIDDFSPSLTNLIRSLIPQRSGFNLPERTLRITIIKATPELKKESSLRRTTWNTDLSFLKPSDKKILEKVASAYQVYRQALKKLPAFLEKVASKNTALLQEIFSSEEFDIYYGHEKIATKGLQVISSSVYFENVHWPGIKFYSSPWTTSTPLCGDLLRI